MFNYRNVIITLQFCTVIVRECANLSLQPTHCTSWIVETVIVKHLFFVWIRVRAPIDQPISRESSASPDLVGDRAAHPVCDH